jgi:hypothetical protein
MNNTKFGQMPKYFYGILGEKKGENVWNYFPSHHPALKDNF